MINGSRKRNLVEHILHGYRDGHKLLASSSKIDELSSSVMARMSDMQPRLLENSSSYICAYPLKKANRYVIARTWPANEMRRPGCVWTHSLLVDYATIAKIDDLTKLLNLLRRPQDSDFEFYRQALDVTDIIQADLPPAEPKTAILSKSHENLNIEDITEVLSTIYARDENRILLSTHREERVDEEIVIAVWNQMPPRLRREFVVCTAANPQSSVPEAEVYLLFWRDSDTERVQQNLKPSVQTDDAVKLLALDALHESKVPVRAFLARYIVDSEHPRQAVLKLVRIAFNLFLNDLRFGLRCAANEIVLSFSSPNDCKLLKKDLLTGGFFANADNKSIEHAISLVVSEVLPSLESLTGFDDVLAVDCFLNLVLKNDKTLLENIVSICEDHNSDTLGALVLQRIVEMLPVEVVAGIRAKAGVKFWLASWNPELLTYRNFWISLTSKAICEDWNLLNIKGQIERLFFNLLNAKKFEVLSELVSKQPSFFAPILVCEMSQLESDMQLATFAALRNHRLELMMAMSSGCSMSVEVVELFAKDIFLQQHPEPRPIEWQSLLAVLPNDGAVVPPFLSYILFLTASHTDLRSAKSLYSYSFQALHDQLSKGHDQGLDGIRLRVLRDFPAVSYENEWDLCGRIRGALARHFISAGEISEEFLRCAKDVWTLRDLVRSMAEMPKGKGWLRLLLRANSKGYIRLTGDEVSVVKAATATKNWFF
jgi:hypothetical protein